MKGYLVRVGIDRAFGKWNAPIYPDMNEVVYVPIPERSGTMFQPGMRAPAQWRTSSATDPGEPLELLARVFTGKGWDEAAVDENNRAADGVQVNHTPLASTHSAGEHSLKSRPVRR